MLRIYANTQFENAEKEHKVLQTLDGFLGPRVYLLDTSKQLMEYDYMVLDYIEGDGIKEFTDESLVEIAEKLKQLHQITYKNENTSLISDWTKINITENSKKLGQDIQGKISPLWEKLTKLHNKVQPLIKTYSPHTLIHDDLILGNFIQTNDGIKLIDWELAHGNYSFMELGGFIEENGLNRQQEKTFLDAYGFGSTQDETKILEFSKAYRITAIVGWFIERVTAMDRGEKVFIDANKEEYMANLREEIEHLDALL